MNPNSGVEKERKKRNNFPIPIEWEQGKGSVTPEFVRMVGQSPGIAEGEMVKGI